MSEEAQWDQFNRNFKDVLTPHEIQIQIFKRESSQVGKSVRCAKQVGQNSVAESKQQI